MISLVKKTTTAAANGVREKPVARYLQLARSIHARFTQEEEKERAARRAAEALAERKNAAIMQPVQEVVQFCEIIRQTPRLVDTFRSNAKDIAQRTLTNRYAYQVEDDPIAVHYAVPVYNVNMKAADGTVISGTENAYLSIGFSPVQIAPSPEKPLPVPSLTAHTFFSKKYHIEPDGKITEDQKAADPIADMLTELRARMGHDYFEAVLLPHLEAQPIH